MTGSSIADPENSTELTLRAIREVQDYVLLVEAGVIEKPAVLFGDTNPEMAIVAERLGLLSDTARQHDGPSREAHKAMRESRGKHRVTGSFNEVREHAFSPATQRLEKALAHRLIASRLGAQAVNS